MNCFSTRIIVTAVLILFNYGILLAGGPDANKPFPETVSFPSSNVQGIIGVTEEIPFDNPADNIFHVNIQSAISVNDKVWLVYELDGVEDHTNVSRSINDQLSIGGYLVRKRAGWRTQREQVNAEWLKPGDNIVRFTMPDNAPHSYKIRNLKFEIEHASQPRQEDVQVIFNQPSPDYFFDKAYIKGFVKGAGAENVKVRIAGTEAKTFNGEFESVFDFSAAQNTCTINVEVTRPDGTSVAYPVVFNEPYTADFVFSHNSDIASVKKYFDVRSTTTLSLGGATVSAPADALQTSAILSITTLRTVDIPALDAGMVNVTKNHAGFRFLPHGSIFNKELGITIPFDAASIPDGYTEQDIRTYYFDDQTHHWIPLPLDTVLTETGEVVSNTLHFTDMINGIIKVPESPEAEAYTSNSMKGIKAANPTAAIALINPPQANNRGAAALSYPLNIPAGRNSMQPQLAISYNSEGGNSWLGLGWNLSVPTISIDTRWGVPRYDPDKETETYVLNGEMLTPVAHRGELRARVRSDERFYPRVEGTFNKIERHGLDPESYWWEVTDKNGTRYLYGGSGGAMDASAVLRTNEDEDSGNVAVWCLRETRDLNGNTVRYHYTKSDDAGVANGSVKGHQIYIDKITYTGKDGGDGPFIIQFFRESTREDKIIAANLGFKEVTGDRLKRVEVKYTGGGGSKLIRAYELVYKTGAFFKSLLSEIKEFDSGNKLFTTHTFDYYDEVNAVGGYTPFDAGLKFDTHEDDINGGFLNKGLSFNDKASLLSGTQSETFGGGVAVTVGPNDQKYASKSNTAGVNYTYSHSTSEGRVLLVDVNGDNLSDKVMMFKNDRNKELKYRPQIKNDNGEIQFGDLRPMNGVNEFLKETSNAHDFGIESNFGIFAGVNYNISKSKTSIYFADANGDGLIDIVKNGKVLFNRLDANGDPEFIDESAHTPNPLISGGTLDGNLITVNPDEVQLLKDRNPLHDVVRMWRAPFDGTVSISAPVALIQDMTEERQSYTTADGVRVSVQLRNEIKWTQDIQPDDYLEKTPSGLSNLDVQKGDRIYFRVHSIEDGSYDKVRWNPVIEYTAHNDTLRNADDQHIYRFTARDEYLVANAQTVGMPIDGKIKIESIFTKPVTSDSILVEILQVKNGVADTLFSKMYGDQFDGSDNISVDAIVSDGDQFLFRVSASSNIQWNDLQWKPVLSYTESYDPAYTDIFDDDGKPLIKIQCVPDFGVYPETLAKTIEWRATEDDTLEIKPVLNFRNFVFTGNKEVTFTIKKKDSLIAKYFLNVKDTLLTDKLTGEAPDAKSVPVKKGDKLFLEFYTKEVLIAENIKRHRATITRGNGKEITVDAALYTVFPPAKRIFGPMYRSWGVFSYNANDGRGELAIDESKLNVDKFNDQPASIDLNNSSSEDDMNSSFESSGGHRSDKEIFVMMYAEGGKQRWMGNDDFTFVNLDTISSSRMGLDQISALFPELSQDAGRAVAVDKITKSNQTSLAASGAGIGGNGSKGNSHVVTDYMDMNGDRYPDILGEYKIQYTLPQGGLEDEARTHGWEFGHRTKLLAGGVSAGGSFAKSGKQAGGTPRKSTFASVGEATSLNVSALWSKDDAEYTWLDINADGLPDRVNADGGKVSLNLGYAFAPEESWGGFEIRKGSAENFSGGLGVNIKNHSIQAGIGYSRSDNTLKQALQDVNGDGLPDKVVIDGDVTVYFNTGNGFSSTPVKWGSIDELSKGASTSWSADVAFTIGFGLIPPPMVVKLCINPKVNYSRGFNREKIQLSDLNGDGYPDYLKSDNDGEVNISASTIGRTNLLREVKRPLGASFTLSYKHYGNTYEMSNTVWALDSVRVFDGFAGDGADYMLSSFRYENGFYDRHEREFYGFAKVITNVHDTEKQGNSIYTKTTQTFNNLNYFEKGLLLNELMTDGADNKYVEKENSYELKNIIDGTTLPASAKTDDAGNAFPALMNTSQKFYEGQAQAGKSTSVNYKYDVLGNIVSYEDLGDEGPEDDILATVTYHAVDGKYIMATPKSIVVTASGVVHRKRESTIDELTGDVTQIRQYLNDTDFAAHDMEYDEYGNLKKITRPKNVKGQRLAFEYEYDGEVHSYVTKVTNSYGYTSEATYDVSFGQKLSTKDINSNEINYEIDERGRVVSITGPYEKGGSNKTIEFEYYPDAAVPWALTKNHDPLDPKNKLQTVTFTDGLARVLQVKKDIGIFDGEGKPDTEVMMVSGRVFFDAFGRTVTAYYPVTAPITTPEEFIKDPDSVQPTTTTYDVLNRAVTIKLPDNAVIKTIYGFSDDRYQQTQFSSKTTDANGKITEHFADVKGHLTSVKNYTSDKAIWTSFKYNAIGEQIEATNDLGHTTYSTYDHLGRRTERKHPDAGTSAFSYDLAGNLNGLVTANLAKEGQSISYDYNFERLEGISYPQNPENNVRYVYGDAGASDNRAGRIVIQEDGSGAQEFFYGAFGEIVKNIRTVIIPQHGEQTYVTAWKYDTWNRLLSMTYADGEIVTYIYNQGGLLTSMTGKKKNASYVYVDQIGYDKFEQRNFLKYGNGTKSTYEYESNRRRLKGMAVQTASGRLFMDNAYEYDNVNNILSLKNNAPIPTANLMGGSSEYTFAYDDLYRLTTAGGLYKGANDEHSYTLSMSYNSVGGITAKTQVHKRKDQEQKKTSYNLAYVYGDAQPSAPLHIGELTYTYDANGNQTGWESDVSGQRRKLMWDEENRLRGVYDNGALYHYLYDASGERVLKGQSTGQRIFVNGEWKAGSGQMGNYTVYVNPYLVLNSGGYTKHYYVEAQRIVSKLGGGWDNNGQGPLKAGDGKVDYAGKNQKVFDGIVKNLKFLGADGQILTAGKSGKIPPGQVKGSGNVTEAFRYFYHPDHVGSTSYVTDASGEVFQHLEYTAWGETLVDDHSNTNRTPYLFNGKELDDETGLYYYGARYYDPRTSIWQSVDPLVDRYPSIAGYTYSGNNPLTYTDPDGKKIKGVKFVNGEYVFSKAAIKNGTDKYIMARIQTETGRSKINAMIADKRTYTIGVTDKTLVLPSGNAGKYALAAGVTDAASGILYISTDKTKLENLTSDQLKNGLVTINNAGDLVPISLNKNQLEKPLEDPNGKYQQDYNRAYEDSGAKEFDSKPENQFENVEQLIHGSGAHEETHLTNEQNIEYSNNDDTYNTEKQAFEVEIQERKEYIKTKSKSDN